MGVPSQEVEQGGLKSFAATSQGKALQVVTLIQRIMTHSWISVWWFMIWIGWVLPNWRSSRRKQIEPLNSLEIQQLNPSRFDARHQWNWWLVQPKRWLIEAKQRCEVAQEQLRGGLHRWLELSRICFVSWFMIVTEINGWWMIDWWLINIVDGWFMIDQLLINSLVLLINSYVNKWFMTIN